MLKCNKCGNKSIIAVEYGYPHPEQYDGVSEFKCQNPECGYRQGRWTGQELTGDMCESRYGRNGVIMNPMTKKKRLEELNATPEAIQPS